MTCSFRCLLKFKQLPLHHVGDADTAGLRDSADLVEQIGVARAWDQIEGADAVLFLHDLTRTDRAEYAEADAEILRWWSGLMTVPCVAIGGITRENAPQLLDAGADCIAVLTALFDAADIRAAAHDLNQLFETESEQ